MIFKSIDENVQSKILKGEYIGRVGNTNLPGSNWSQLADDAGLCTKCGRDFYRFVCAHSHSGGWSISQIIAGSQGEKIPDSTPVSLGQMMVFMSFMIRAYVNKFPKANAVIQDASELVEIIEKWLYVGSGGIIERI